jgi:hypothetical protein
MAGGGPAMKPLRERRAASVGATTLVLGVVGMADHGFAANFPSREGLPAPVLPDCTCRFHGRDLPLGARVCLSTPEGAHYAQCVRELNVTSWRFDAETCAEARSWAPPAL